MFRRITELVKEWVNNLLEALRPSHAPQNASLSAEYLSTCATLGEIRARQQEDLLNSGVVEQAREAGDKLEHILDCDLASYDPRELEIELEAVRTLLPTRLYRENFGPHGLLALGAALGVLEELQATGLSDEQASYARRTRRHINDAYKCAETEPVNLDYSKIQEKVFFALQQRGPSAADDMRSTLVGIASGLQRLQGRSRPAGVDLEKVSALFRTLESVVYARGADERVDDVMAALAAELMI